MTYKFNYFIKFIILNQKQKNPVPRPHAAHTLEEVSGRPCSVRGSVVILEDGDGRSGCRFSGLITGHNIPLGANQRTK